MSSDAQAGDDGSGRSLAEIPSEWYDTLRHPRRIRLLDALQDGTSPFTLMELTAAVVDREPGEIPDGQAFHDVRVSLVHNHLPRLAESGMLEWDGETVTLVDEAPLPTRDLSVLLAASDAQNRLLEVLVHPVRIQLYTILRERNGPLSVEQLATELAGREAVSLSSTDEARIALYHAHLPAMDDVGALEFDRQSGTVWRSDRSTPSMTS
jgi:hypothetical protein